MLTSSFLPIVNFISIQEIKAQMMPWLIEEVRGIKIIPKKAGIASSSLFQFILITGFIMNTPTSTKAGAVAMAGMIESIGEKNIKGRNNNPATTAVKPVRPPSSTPAADSI